MAIHKALRAFEDLSRSTIGTIKTTKTKLVPVLEDIASRDLWRYLAILGVSILVFVVWTALMCGAPCGCENVARAIPYLIIGLTFACLISLLLWILGSAALLLGIHGQNIICNALYDPNYTDLSYLLDDKGIVYPRGGFFRQLLKLNESVRMADVFRYSERNQSSYKTFKLKSIVDIENLLNYNNSYDINRIFNSFHLETKNLKLVSTHVESYLMDLSSASKVNLTAYRKKINSPITTRDMSSLLDQAYAIAKQITDSKAGTRLDKLIFRLRDIMNKDYKKLNEIRDVLFYELTALDVILKPFQKTCEDLLGKVRKIQATMGITMEQIAKQKSMNYMGLLKNYLELSKTHVEFQIIHQIARLKPLWNIFFTARVFVCDEFIGAMNALSFSCYFSILLIIILTPITRRIIKRYREINEDLLGRIHYRNSGADDDDRRSGRNGWETPRSPGTPVRRNQNDESAWASPRQSISNEVPPPPRPPSSSGRSSSPRPAVPSISKTVAAFSSKYDSSTIPPIPKASKGFSSGSRYDSLKLIERSTWRTPASPEATPRRWI